MNDECLACRAPTLDSRVTQALSISIYFYFPCIILLLRFSHRTSRQNELSFEYINAIVNDEIQGHFHFRIHSRDPQNCPQLPRPLQIILFIFLHNMNICK